MINFTRNYKTELITFRLGIFLLASAPFISSLLLIFSLIVTCITKWRDFFKDKWNFPFIAASFLMLLISILHLIKFGNFSFPIPESIEIREGKMINWPPISSLIGLSNWLPLFLSFWGFQPYLKSSKDREIVGKLLIAGSVPVLISGFGQYWFQWYGPIQTLNGLIIWFQREGGGQLTSLFSNQNYAGCWLNIIWPFSIALFFCKTKNLFKQGSSLIFLISIALASLLTSSRNALLGLLLTIPLILGSSAFYWLIPLFTLLGILIFLKILNINSGYLDGIIDSLLPFPIFDRLTVGSNAGTEISNRRILFIFALQKISERPLIGFGAASFPFYYFLKDNYYMGHAHNLIIDTAFNYGLIVTLLIFSNILILLFLTIKHIYFSKYLDKSINIFFERAWLTSFFILFLSQMFDVQYFDIRISISFWILLAGMKCMLIQDKFNPINNS